MIIVVGQPNVSIAVECAAILLAGAAILGGQPGINALAASSYSTELRATGVGWCLGIGRVGSILGPLTAAELIARQVTNEFLFVVAAVPAALASLLIVAMASTQPGRERHFDSE